MRCQACRRRLNRLLLGCARVQGEVDDAIAELERLRRAAETHEAAVQQLRKRAGSAQAVLRQTR